MKIVSTKVKQTQANQVNPLLEPSKGYFFTPFICSFSPPYQLDPLIFYFCCTTFLPLTNLKMFLHFTFKDATIAKTQV